MDDQNMKVFLTIMMEKSVKQIFSIFFSFKLETNALTKHLVFKEFIRKFAAPWTKLKLY
jgi:hypothetical protein